jgi:hypothetical protein
MTPAAAPPAARAAGRDAADLTVAREMDGRLVLHLAGPWKLGGTPSMEVVERALRADQATGVRFDAGALAVWDTSLALFVTRV